MTNESTSSAARVSPPIALVTGGSRGLGRAAALALAEAGSDLILTFHRREDEAKAVVASIEGLGRKAVALPLDVGRAAGFGDFAAAVEEALRTIWQRERFDQLVNNAGIGMDGAIGEITEAQLDELFAIHVKAPLLLVQRLLPLMNDGGRILNVSSGLTRIVYPGKAAYAACKSAVEMLTTYMAKELGPRRIAVNVIAPGAIATDFGGGTVRDNPQVNAHIASITALGRTGLPDDIGGAVAALLDPRLHWMNAQRVEVSGGQAL